MKKFKTGLFVGKFVAYHKGHQHFINHFSSMCHKLKLVLCTKPSDLVDGNIRKAWLENDLKYNIHNEINEPQNIELFLLKEDDIPLYPEGLVQWCKAISNLVGDFEIMFGNEEYVIDSANMFKCEYYIPDIKRKKINISSTEIYKNKLKYYDLLTTVAKPHFNKKVSITGVESTGKTTLAKNIAESFGGLFIEEYGRTYYENKVLKTGLHGFNNWTVQDFENIAYYHNSILEDAMSKPNKLIILDTDALITEIFSNIYIRQTSEELQNIVKNQKFDLTVLLDYANTNWKNDGVRMLGDDRAFMNEYLKFSLNYFQKDFKIFFNSDGYENRYENVKKYIEHEFKI